MLQTKSGAGINSVYIITCAEMEKTMDIRAYLNFLAVAEKLKCNTRHSWTSTGRHESVAEHSWRLALMAYLVRDEFPELDMDRVIQMCLFHDMGEAVTGDIPAFEKSQADEETEKTGGQPSGRDAPGALPE